MARREFYQQPNHHNKRDDDKYAEDEGWSPSTSSSRSKSVSDNAQNTVNNIDDVLRDQEENSQTQAPTSASYADYTGAQNGSTTSSSHLAGAEGLAASSNITFTPSDPEKRSSVRSWLGRNRKKALAGGLVGLLFGGTVFLGMPALGAAELVQLGHVLQQSSSKSEDDSSVRLSKLLRYARAFKNMDFGETRVGFLGSKYFGTTLNQLRDIGVTFDRSATGAPTKTTIDTDKLKTSYPELDGMDDAAKKNFIADKLGITADQIAGSGSEFSIDQKDFSVKASRLVVKSSVGLLDDGNISAYLKMRILTEFFNLPSLFHPIDRAMADKVNDLAANGTKRQQAEEKAEQSREAQLTEAPEAEAAAAVEDVKSKSGTYNSTAMKALTFTGGACFLRSVTGDIITINRDRVVVPSAIRAVDIVAVGSQVANGQDLDATQAGAIDDSLTDSNGQSVWGGAAVQALENGGKVGDGYVDLAPDFTQAFSGDTTAATIRDWTNKALGGRVLSAAACSRAGIAVQIAASVFLAVSSAVADVGSGGTLTPAVVAGWTALKLGTSFLVSGVAFHFLQSFIIHSNTAKTLATDAFSGPMGGDLLAYGSVAANNITSIASGGINLGSDATALLAANEAQKSQTQFESQNFFARMFNIYDYHSLAGQLADYVSPSWSANVSMLATSLTHIGSIVPHLFSALIPKASADSSAQAYQWQIPTYGLPNVLLEDQNLEDPYANADYVAKNLLDTNAKDPYGIPYTNKVQACFGDDITKNSGKWDVVHQTAVDPSDAGYIDAHCGNISDENWRRVIMFIFDTTDMKTAACWQGDDQSCSDEGLGSNPGSTGATGTTINTSTLYQSSVGVSCAQGTTDLGNTTGYTNGNPVQIHLCGIPDLPSSSEESTPGDQYYVQGANGDAIVNARVSGAFLALVQAAKAAGIPMHANSSFRTMAHQQALWNQDPNPVAVARPGTSNHQMGLAIDFTMDNTGKFNDSTSTCVNVSGRCEAPGDKVWEWLNSNASNYGIKPYVNEYWHWSPTGN